MVFQVLYNQKYIMYKSNNLSQFEPITAIIGGVASWWLGEEQKKRQEEEARRQKELLDRQKELMESQKSLQEKIKDNIVWIGAFAIAGIGLIFILKGE